MLQKTIGQILPEATARFGDKTALIFGDRTFSYAELDHLSNRIAHGLSTMGIAPGDRVTLYAQNGWEWVVSYYGIAKTGAVLNPINVMLTPDEVGFVVKDCGAKALFTTAELPGAIFDLCNLHQTHFAGARLAGAQFRQADLTYADFSQADLAQVDATEAIMFRTILHGAGTIDARFSDRARALETDPKKAQADAWQPPRA